MILWHLVGNDACVIAAVAALLASVVSKTENCNYLKKLVLGGGRLSGIANSLPSLQGV